MMGRMQDSSGLRGSRRGFLVSAPLLVATLVRCSHTLWNQTRFADAFVIDPDASAYRPALDAVIAAVLPFESETRYAGLQRTIALFDQIDLFNVFSGPLLQEEAIARDIAQRGGDLNQLAAMIRD